MKWCSDTSSLLGLNARSNSDVGVGATNTATASTCAGGAIKAASTYASATKSDWFLGSIGEMMLMYTNLRQAGVGGFSTGAYWSSTEYLVDGAWFQIFGDGNQGSSPKGFSLYVRPVRAF